MSNEKCTAKKRIRLSRGIIELLLVLRDPLVMSALCMRGRAATLRLDICLV